MGALAVWLLLFGVWPLGTFEAHHADLSAPILTADIGAHLLGLALLAARRRPRTPVICATCRGPVPRTPWGDDRTPALFCSNRCQALLMEDETP